MPRATVHAPSPHGPPRALNMKKVQSKDGSQIAFERLGSGPPVVLVGGAFSDHRVRAAGLPLARALESALTVFCYDRRGRGESTAIEPYAIAREVDDLAALLAVAGGSAHVYGHSSGAILALEATLAGLPIERLALYEPPLVLGDLRERMPPDLAAQLVDLTLANQRSAAAELFLTRGVGVPAPAVEQMKRGPAWSGFEAVAHSLSNDAQLAEDPESILARAAGLSAKTLLLNGEKSQPWMRSGVEKLAAAIPGVSRATLPGQAHDVEPQALAPQLLEFFLA